MPLGLFVWQKFLALPYSELCFILMRRLRTWNPKVLSYSSPKVLKIETIERLKLVILGKRYLDMTSHTINIELPSDILLTLNESEFELKKRIKHAFAIQLYTQEKVTIGKAAQIADMTRFQFETLLSEHKIPISNLDIEDILSDIEKLVSI